MRSDPIGDSKSCSAVLVRLRCDWTAAAGGGRILALHERSMGNFGIQSFHAEPQEMNLRAAIFCLAHNRRGLRGAL
jgi:hypothetical protein